MQNIFKSTYRNFVRNSMYSIINLLGLVIGILSLLLTLSWANYELGFDGFHEKKDRIYKICQGENFSTVPPLFSHIRDEFPEIEKIIRTSNDAEAYISGVNSDNKVKVNNILYTSADFDEIFTCNTIGGNIRSTLNDANGIVLTRKAALKIFGKTDVEGNVVKYGATFPLRELTLTVRSVIDDFPSNSTLKFEAIIPFDALDNIKPNGMKPDDNWRDGYCNIYVLLKEGTNSKLLGNKLQEFGGKLEQVVYGLDPKSPRAEERKLGLVNVTDLHFFNNNKRQLVGYVLFIGFLILLIAIINYVNLTIAKLFMTYKTLFVRKINGASRLRLIRSILAESILFSLLAFLVALIFIEAFNPLLSRILNIEPPIAYREHPGPIFMLLGMAIFVGVAAGLFPALKLTSNIPVHLAQTNFLKKGRHFIRMALVIFQFTISIALIICVFVISKQLQFLNKKNVGFDNHQIIYAQLNKNLYGSYTSFKEKLLRNPNVKSVSGSQNELGQVCVTLSRDINGTSRQFQELPADPDFIETMGMQLKMGRNFSWDMQTDRYQTVILNETAVKAFQLDSNKIIGTEIFMYDRKARVIGVVKDFYFQSFHHILEPFMLYYHPDAMGTVSLKISGNNTPETIKYIDQIWCEFSPDIPFEYHFLDKTYQELYQQDRHFSRIIILFLLVAIIIACLGLFGLVSYTTVQLTKEIGIRKVNGARISEVMVLLNREFVQWVAIAFVIATPIAYYAMHKWLENFAYKTELSWWIFALAGLLALGIALLTVSWQSWKAATRNPVEALRYE